VGFLGKGSLSRKWESFGLGLNNATVVLEHRRWLTWS
jgi:hypothetical protein